MDISQNNFLYIRVECFRGQKQAKKKKKTGSEKIAYISGNGTF